MNDSVPMPCPDGRAAGGAAGTLGLSVFGLGYVGTVTAACFAKEGHRIIGVDLNPDKVAEIGQGRSPVVEDGVEALLAGAAADGRLRATADPADAIRGSDMSIVCVGTPSAEDGALDVSHLIRVCEEIGGALADRDGFHIVILRSTVLPGTTRGQLIPTLERASGRTAGVDFGVCHNPEFLRESTAVRDFYNPPRTVIGAADDRTAAAVAALYAGIDAPLIQTPIEIAEMVKYADNNWHALKVGFANEIGNICKAVGVDSHAVMEIFCADDKLNISSAYLRPGFAFGGSCLPKDVRALRHRARALGLSLPILESVLPSNEQQIARAVERIAAKGQQRIGILGISFKAGTDDLRESPMIEVAARLLERGFDLRLYDPCVRLDRLTGANRDFIGARVPDLSARLVDDLDSVLDHGAVIVVGNNDPAFQAVPARLGAGQILIDMVRLEEPLAGAGQYDGINW